MTDSDALTSTPDQIGPILYMRGVNGGRVDVAAVVVQRKQDAAPVLYSGKDEVYASLLFECLGRRVYQFAFSLPAQPDSSYSLNGCAYTVNADFEADLRLAYVSCNGKEHGDRARPLAERNAMWERLVRQHEDAPFNLLLHGGDQLYSDEILTAHPAVHDWAESNLSPPDERDVDPSATEETLREVLFERYLELFSHPELAWLSARVPALAMWDDHDICDGWGSLPTEKLDSTVGQIVFKVAREMFLTFQIGASSDDLPRMCSDLSGDSLSWYLTLPGLNILAPDLRSERRPRRVMGERGWSSFREAAAAAEGSRILVMSSVPALGPRLSWVEALMAMIPAMQKYEDDLRDQWQSRAHRAEWRDFLRTLLDMHGRGGAAVTVLSGEIHLATRATLETSGGPIHQLVASGITHPPPPKLYARALGGLARLGEAPLPGHPIRLHCLPGQSTIYTAERNYLVLERREGRWRTWWELEESGATPSLSLD